jgi:hypothetical protein
MTIHSTRHSFMPWNPYPHEGKDPNCLICYDPLTETPETPDQIPVKHEGPDGEKHPPAHLGCLMSWLEKSDLCMLCKHPLDKEQILLFLDELETLDFPSLSFQELSAMAREIVDLLKTPEGNLRRAAISLKKAIKNLEDSFLSFTTCSTRHENLLQEAIRHVEEMLEASREEDYLEARQLLSTITSSILRDYEENYSPILNELTNKRTDYLDCSIIYILNKENIYITKEIFNNLQQSRYPLIEYFETPLLEKAHELKLSDENYLETSDKIRALERVFFTLAKPDDDLKLEILIMNFLFLFMYTTLDECSINREQDCSLQSPAVKKIKHLSVSFIVSFLFTTFLFLSLEKNKNYQEAKEKLNDFFICKIKIPLKNTYQTLKAVSNLIKEAS